MSYSNASLEAMIEHGGSVGCLAQFALDQRKSLAAMQDKLLSLQAKVVDGDPLERRIRDMAAENKRLRIIIAELQSK